MFGYKIQRDKTDNSVVARRSVVRITLKHKTFENFSL